MTATFAWRAAAFVLAALALAGAGSARAGDEEEDVRKYPSVLTAKPLEITPKDDEEQKLLKELYNERVTLAAGQYKRFLGGHVREPDDLLASARRLQQTGMELRPRPADQVKFLKEIQKVCKKVDAIIDIRKSQGALYREPDVLALDESAVRTFKREVDLALLKAKKAAAKEK